MTWSSSNATCLHKNLFLSLFSCWDAEDMSVFSCAFFFISIRLEWPIISLKTENIGRKKNMNYSMVQNQLLMWFFFTEYLSTEDSLSYLMLFWNGISSTLKQFIQFKICYRIFEKVKIICLYATSSILLTFEAYAMPTLWIMILWINNSGRYF